MDFGRPSYEGWTDEQKKALSITPKVTGTLSILGSSFIIYDIVRDRKKWSSTYHRLLLGIAMYDWVCTWGFMLSTTPMPSDSSVYEPMGNQATCTAQGFIIQFSIGSPIYNLMLAIYFLLSIDRRTWSKERIQKRVEPWLHATPFTWSLITSVIALAQDGYNDSMLWCWMASSPKGCHKDDTCTQCPLCTVYYRWIFFYIPLWLSAFGTMITMALLVYRVRKTEQKAAQWRGSVTNVQRSSTNISSINAAGNVVEFDSESESYMDNGSSEMGRSTRSKRDKQKEKQKKIEEDKEAFKMTQKVKGQAFRYCIVFWITWLPGTTNRIVQLIQGYSYFYLMFFHVVLSPMQGFWNFFVYIYPRVFQKDDSAARRSMATTASFFRRSRASLLSEKSQSESNSKTNRGSVSFAIEEESDEDKERREEIKAQITRNKLQAEELQEEIQTLRSENKEILAKSEENIEKISELSKQQGEQLEELRINSNSLQAEHKKQLEEFQSENKKHLEEIRSENNELRDLVSQVLKQEHST